jgi:hypothetical protein
MLDRLPESPGIYLMEFAGTGDSYVGQSVNIRCRVYSHLFAQRNNRPGNRLFRRVHMAGRRTFRVLELCGRANLDERETHWIHKLRPNLNVRQAGPNCSPIGEGCDTFYLRTSIDADLLMRLKLACVVLGKPVGEAVDEAIKCWLENHGITRVLSGRPPKAKK